MIRKAYRLKRDRVLRGDLMAAKGHVVYRSERHDYGLANDDSRMTGVEHWSMTFHPEGSGEAPHFTIPVADLEEIA